MSDDATWMLVKTFIADHIDSVVQLEVLLLFHREPQKAWRAEEVARSIRIDAAWVTSQMAYLQARGLLKRAEGSEPLYRYGPRTDDLHQAVVQVAQAYAQRRVSVINMIYTKPVDKLRSFSEAFRFRKSDSDG